MNPILVIGGGISGITAAVELAEAGKEVILLEKSSHLGGNVARMHTYFPKLCPPACGLEINFRRIRNNPRIKVLTHAELISLEGVRGNMNASIQVRAKMVNDFCTSCGDCIEVCPVERQDEFNYGYTTTKAIFIPSPLAFPGKYEIDPVACKGESCGKCKAACSYDAIDLAAQPETLDVMVHSVVVATGWKSNGMNSVQGLNYGNHPDIVRNVEFERLISVTGPGEGKLFRPSNGETPSNIAFIQCAGSRDRNYLPYCSAVCCSASLKHALNLTDLLPDVSVTIFYIDLRVSGRNEDFLRKVEENNRIKLVKGKAGKVYFDPGTGRLIVEAEDILHSKKVSQKFDLVVLAAGIVPSGVLSVRTTDQDGFLQTDMGDGVYAAGCAKRPMDVSASVKDATAAALMAMKV